MTALPDRDSPGRIRHLDGLRGVAALTVFVAHLAIVVFPAVFNGLPEMTRLRYEWMLAGTPLGLLWAANFAVCIFFVMSALVLSYFYEREGGNFVAVCVRRYFRLALPILATSFVAYALWASGAMFNLKAQAVTQEGWLKSQYLAEPHFWDFITESLYRVFVVANSQYNPVLWTMKYELEGSIGVFALYALIPQTRLRLVVLGAAFVLLFGSYYMCFVGGMLIYEWTKAPAHVRNAFPVPASWALLLGGAYMGAFPYNVATPDNFWFGRMTFLGVEQWHMLGAIPLVFGCMTIPAVCRFFNRPLLQYLGKISFSLYLVHGIVICSFMSFLIVSLYWPPHARLAMFVAAAVTVPVTFACAHVTYLYVDRPAVKFSRLVGRWLDVLSSARARGSAIDEPVLAAATPTPAE